MKWENSSFSKGWVGEECHSPRVPQINFDKQEGDKDVTARRGKLRGNMCMDQTEVFSYFSACQLESSVRARLHCERAEHDGRYLMRPVSLTGFAR